MAATERPRRLRPLPLAAALAWALGVWILSSMSDPPGGGLLTFAFRDKLVHFGLFLVQAALLRLGGLRPAIAAGIAIALGAVDETHQAFVPGRSPDAADLLADALGAVAGTWLADRLATGRGPAR